MPDDVEYLIKRVVGYLTNGLGLVGKVHTLLSCGHYVNHALFDLNRFGACPICQFAAPELDASKPAVVELKESTPLKMLNLATELSVLEAFSNVVAARTSISASYKTFLRAVIAAAPANAEANLPADIAFKENAAVVAAAFIKEGIRTVRLTRTATDVLRLAVALCDGDVSLKEPTRFKLKNGERVLVLECLEDIAQQPALMAEEMNRTRERWLRLGEVLHVGQYAKRFPKAAAVFDQLRNNASEIGSYNGRVAAFIEKSHLRAGEAAELLALLSERPGELARKVDALLQKGGVESRAVLETLRCVIDKVSTNILLTMSAHFRHRDTVAEFRAFMPKGMVANMFYSEGDTRFPLPQDVRLAVLDIVGSELSRRMAQREPLGKVFIDDSLDGIIVPFSQRSASTALTTLPRGSRVPFNADKGFLRLFTHWTETDESEQVDLDLTCALFDENWVKQDHLSWTNMNSYGRSRHSGDVRSAPAPTGASEFIDLDIEALKCVGVRYAAVMAFSWTGQSFDQFDAFAGFMERDDSSEGDHFEARTVTQKFAVSGPTKILVPMIVDILEGTVVWADLSLKGHDAYNCIENQQERVVQMARAILGLRKTRPSLYDLFLLHAQARGTLVESEHEADLVLNQSKLFELDDVAANWL